MGAAAAATDDPLIGRLVDVVPDGIVVADDAGVIRFVNRALAELVGADAAQLTGRSVETLVPDVIRDAHTASRDAHVRSGSSTNPMGGLETYLRTDDDHAIPVDVTVSTAVGADGPLAVICLRDARSRRQMEQAVGGSERRLRELYEAVPMAILALDRDGMVTYANPFLCDLLGMDLGDLVGGEGRVLLHGVERTMAEASEAHASFLASAAPAHAEAHVTDGLDRSRILGWYTIPIHDDAGEVVGSLSIGEDLTAHLRSDRVLRSTEEVGRAVLAGLPAADVERLVCERACEVTGARHALVARPGREGCEVRAAAGPAAEALIGRAASAPWCSSDSDDLTVFATEGFSQLDPSGLGIGPTVMVPLSSSPNRGFLMVANAPGEPPFEAETTEALRRFAAQVTLALEYGSRLRDLAIVEDRERIARDLHDLVIQRIFSAGLSLQITAQLIADRPDAAERLTSVSTDLDAAIAELRRSILGLQESGGRHLRRRVANLAAEATDGSGLEVHLDVPADVGQLPETLVRNLLAVLREALANVVRHARAGRVDVTVEVGESLVLSVRDDGIGLSADSENGGWGLGNLADRARQLGGTLRVTEPEAGGLLVQWRVPMLPPPHG